MELHQLRYFVAVAETLSFSRAAVRCHVAQPSLSQQVRKLEDHLDHRLFDRLPRGVALTEAGRALLPRARRILAEVNAVNPGIQEDIQAGRGSLVVGAIPTMAPYLLPPVLRQFTRRFPECELSLREDLTERLIDALVDHEIDVAVMSTPVDNPLIHLEVIGRERLLLAAAKNHKLPTDRTTIRITDLGSEPAVVLHEMHCLGQQIESFCAAKRMRRRIVCRSTQLPTVLELVSFDLGISLVPEMCAREDASALCRYRALGRDGPAREIAVAYHSDRTLSHLGREFLTLLRGNVQGGRHRFRG